MEPNVQGSHSVARSDETSSGTDSDFESSDSETESNHGYDARRVTRAHSSPPAYGTIFKKSDQAKNRENETANGVGSTGGGPKKSVEIQHRLSELPISYDLYLERSNANSTTRDVPEPPRLTLSRKRLRKSLKSLRSSYFYIFYRILIVAFSLSTIFIQIVLFQLRNSGVFGNSFAGLITGLVNMVAMLATVFGRK
jgi:hypothetical protein